MGRHSPRALQFASSSPLTRSGRFQRSPPPLDHTPTQPPQPQLHCPRNANVALVRPAALSPNPLTAPPSLRRRGDPPPTGRAEREPLEGGWGSTPPLIPPGGDSMWQNLSVKIFWLGGLQGWDANFFRQGLPFKDRPCQQPVQVQGGGSLFFPETPFFDVFGLPETISPEVNPFFFAKTRPSFQ